MPEIFLFLTMIAGRQQKCCGILLLHWIRLCLLLTLSKSMFSELPVLIPLVLYLIRSVSAEGSLNCILAFDLGFLLLTLIESTWFMALIPLSLYSFPL